MKLFLRISIGLVFVILSGCGSSFNIKQLAKGDIDFVADRHREILEEHTYTLLEKLYRRNPKELHKTPGATIDSQRQRLASMLVENQPLLIDELEGVALLAKAFEVNNSNRHEDRVFLLVGGLLSMLHKSYSYRNSFYLFDNLDQQKLYHCARNIEVLAWRLRISLDTNGQPLLLSNGLSAGAINLSFERLLGKMIALQDMMAQVTADSSRRTINKVAHSVASIVFIPL